MEAYIRVGNESIVAPDHLLNEQILKGTNRSFDAIITEERKDDYSFTLLEATYLEKVGIHFTPSDYISFGLADNNRNLTNAGKLMADQHVVRNSRIFCTRWNGLTKGSIFDDALDDKEYEGNLISLLRNSIDFVRNNSKVRFVKEAQSRVDKPDYAERAVTEAIVNALIHCDYILLGSEIHIDMFDNRLEIQSSGGMYDGRPIQDRDIHTIASVRRKAVIADLFHRMKFMERRGSGLTKIISETEKLPGYDSRMKAEFYSTPSDFRVVLKNVNYFSVTDTAQDNQQDNQQVSVQEKIFQYCSIPRRRIEIAQHCGYKDVRYFSSSFLNPLLESERLQMTIPDKPNSRNQKYVAVQSANHQ